MPLTKPLHDPKTVPWLTKYTSVLEASLGSRFHIIVEQSVALAFASNAGTV